LARSCPAIDLSVLASIIDPHVSTKMGVEQLLAQIQGNQAAMDAFVSINAATVSPADFFNPAYLGQLLAA
jgi:hypothetical protein